MDQRAQDSNLPSGEMSSEKFSSLSLSRACIDSVQWSVGALEGGDLIDALGRLDNAYDEFPELELERPRRAVLEGLQSTAQDLPDRAAIPLLMYCAAAGLSCSSALASLVERIIKSDSLPLLPAVLRSSCRDREFCWGAIEQVINMLRQRGRPEMVVQLISEVLSCTKFSKDEDAAEAGEVLQRLLGDPDRLGIDSAMLAWAMRSARDRLSHPSLGQNEAAPREALLTMAERLRSALSPPRLTAHDDLGWPSGRMSFNEFLLQWPCEVELPAELNDLEFIQEAHRAILLRGPDITEENQYLRLLQDGVASQAWILEDLLASKELRSLERSVRVIFRGQPITGPGTSPEDTPAVTWPWRSAGG